MGLVLILIAKVIAFVVAVILMIGGVFRMGPHRTSRSLYVNVLLIFLGSTVLLIGIFIPGI